MEYRYKPTTHGRAVMAACMALEKPLKITRVAFGSGKVEEDANLADVHELLAYVSDGAISERRHESDRVYLTIQFANKAHPEVKTFLLSEFIVYVEDPETGTDTDLLYGTLGDYRQPVPAFNPAFPPSVFNFPLELIISDEISVAVSAPAGLVTHDELLWALDNLAAGAAKQELAVPATGWGANPEADNPYPFYLDIACADVRETKIPVLSILPSSIPTAQLCELCPVSRSMDGLLRIYAKTVPIGTIQASLTLLDTARDGRTGLAGSAATGKIDVIVSSTGWETDTDTAGAYSLHLDIADAGIREAQVPMLTILPKSLETAGSCGLSGSARTLPGVLRVYAKTAPGQDIHASLALLSTASGVNVDNIPAYVMPTASEDTIGGVRVKRGSGLTVDGSGNLAIDAAGNSDVEELFGSDAGSSVE